MFCQWTLKGPLTAFPAFFSILLYYDFLFLYTPPCFLISPLRGYFPLNVFVCVYFSESLWYNKFDLKSSYSSFFIFAVTLAVTLIAVTLFKLKVILSHLHNHRKLCGHMSFFPQNNFDQIINFYVYDLISYMC